MKKILITGMTAVLLMMIGMMSTYAYADKAFSELSAWQADGIYTKITDTQGKTHMVDGMIKSKDLESGGFAEKVASYEVFSDGESVMNVKLNDIVSENDDQLTLAGDPIVNGYYSVKFTLSEEENTEAFLTGLSDSNIDLVQEALIQAKIENSQFSLESLDFIDAEKTEMPGDGDDLLCWAAAASNTLHYTGWGEKAGFLSPDDLFDVFNANFTDYGSQSVCGFEWFFSGVNPVQGRDNWAQVKDYGHSGKYLPKYSAQQNMEYIEVSEDHREIVRVFDALETGYGVGITLGWINDGVRNGGHAITLWGYIADKDFAQWESERYKALIVADSDSDMPEESNRRIAPNKLNVLNMVPYTEAGYDTWLFEGYALGSGVLEAFTTLVPYSDEVAYEEDQEATLDKFNNYEFTVSDLYLSNDSMDDDVTSTSFAKGDTIYLIPEFENSSILDFPAENTLLYDVTIKAKGSGEALFTESCSYSGGIEWVDFSDQSKTKKLEISTADYATGTYEAEITIKKSEHYKEAFYYNNKRTYDFIIAEKKYDLSDVKINAEIEEAKDGEIQTQISYAGLEQLELLQRDDVRTVLYHSYYADGKWGEWENAYTGDQPGVGKKNKAADILPDRCVLYPNGEKVKFRLAITTDDKAVPMVNLYSDECELKYVKLEIEMDEAHTEVCTPIESGGKSLVNGEKIAVYVTDQSTQRIDDLSCNVILYADKDGEEIELKREMNVMVPPGGMSACIEMDAWDAELDGKYDVIVKVESVYGSKRYPVSSLIVGKQYVYQVTTGEDTEDAGDGETSLREAVALLGESGGDAVITFSEDIKMVQLKQPIVIDHKISIEGRDVLIFGGQNTQLFKVESGGELYCNTVILTAGYSEENGGAVENNGGNVYIENSRIINSKSGISGGGIYTNGGNVTLKNCTIKGNNAGYGGAIGTGHDAKVQLLNCNLWQNQSHGGAVYHNSGQLTVVYSIIAENYLSKSTSLETGGITSLGTADVFGSIITKNDGYDLSGNIRAYGNYLTKADHKVEDYDCMYGSGAMAFMLDENLNMYWDAVTTDQLLGSKTKLSAVIDNGIYIKNQDEKIAYSTDGSHWKQTDVGSVFTDEAYAHDMFGKPHGALFGSDAESADEVKIVGGGNGQLIIYLPDPQNAVLIDKREAENGIQTGLVTEDMELNYGTNIVQTDAYEGKDKRIFMLWNSLEEMNPLCAAFTMGEDQTDSIDF